LGFNVVEFVQRGIQCGGFSGPGRSRHQHDAVGAMDDLTELRECRRVHADLAEVQLHHGAVEHTHNDRFTEHGGQHAHAQVDGVATHVQFNTTVLWHATFGNVEVRHHLHAADDGRREVARWRNHFVQHAVRPHA